MPEPAALVLSLDLEALRRSKVASAWLSVRARQPRAAGSFDPALDLDRITLAVSGESHERGPDFVVLLQGRARLDQLLALARQGRAPLEPQQRRGLTVYSDPGETVLLLAPREGLVVAVSGGWAERLLDRLEQRGLSVLENDALAPLIVHAAGPRHSAWLAGLLSPALGAWLGARTGLAELRDLVSVEGSADAGSSLSLAVTVRLRDAGSAQRLEGGLRHLLEQAPAGHVAKRRVSLVQADREIRAGLSLSASELRALWAVARTRE